MSARRSTTLVPRSVAAGRRVLVGLAIAAIAAVVLGSGMPAARAHDEVVATTPAHDSVVATSPQRVELELSRPAQALGSRVLVSGPDGAAVSQGAVELRNTSVAQPLAADLPPGTYTVQWQVTSSDGHPITGTSTFTVAAPGSGAAAPDEPRTEATAPARQGTDPVGTATAQGAERSPSTAWIAVGAVALIAAGGLAVRRLSPRW